MVRSKVVVGAKNIIAKIWKRESKRYRRRKYMKEQTKLEQNFPYLS